MPSRALTAERIAARRLGNQRLIGTPFATAREAVGFLGAVQAQDFAGAKWGIAQRVKNGSDAQLEQAFARGELLRTHVLRPTWHFVLPDDIRWLLALTASRIHAASAYYYRRAGLDGRTIARSQAAFERALRGGQHRTRDELAEALRAAGVAATGERLGLLVMHAELDALICSGPRRGKQFTYALLEERAPNARAFDRDRALAELARRYFQSRGPATVHDFAWWSGLTVTDARAGVAQQPELVAESLEGKQYFAFPTARKAALKSPVVHLLPNYDEHLIAYKGYANTLDPGIAAKVARSKLVVANHLVALDGLVIGGWRRSFEAGTARIEAQLLSRVAPAVRAALEAAAERYGRFTGMDVELDL